MLTSVLLLQVVFSLDTEASYADVAAKVQQRFPHAVVQRDVDHELLTRLAARATDEHVDLARELTLMRRFVRVSVRTHPSDEVLAFVSGLPHVERGAYVTGPVQPGLRPVE